MTENQQEVFDLFKQLLEAYEQAAEEIVYIKTADRAEATEAMKEIKINTSYIEMIFKATLRQYV